MKVAESRHVGKGVSAALHLALSGALLLPAGSGELRPKPPTKVFRVTRLVDPPKTILSGAPGKPARASVAASVEPAEVKSGIFDRLAEAETTHRVARPGQVVSGLLPGASAIVEQGEVKGYVVTGELDPGNTFAAAPARARGSVRRMTGSQGEISPFGDGSVASTEAVLLSAPMAPYTEEAKRLKIHGNVVLRVRLPVSGPIYVLAVVQSLGHGLDESAIDAAKALRFRPARNRSGMPIDSLGTVTVKFDFV